MRPAIVLLTIAIIPTVYAQHLKVSRVAWDGLSSEERAAIQARSVVEVYEHGSFGLVIDAQGADRSDPGTNAGAVIGSAAAQAAYIDRAFSGNNNYSALTQLGMALAGGILGSTLDRPASQKYQFRYALKLSNGEIQYADAMNQDPFRHPPGVCLSLPGLRPISQAICSHGPDDLRRQLLGQPSPIQATPQAVAAVQPMQPAQQAPSAAPTAGTVMCRLGSLAPVSTTAEKCTAIGGTQQ